jgi:hypothetical protein
MTDHYKLGPGTLTLGTAPDDEEFSMQLTVCAVEPSENVTEGDDLNLLDGTTLNGDDTATLSYVLSGTAVQDLLDNGFTAYTWANKGDEVAFEFVPVTARVASVTGTVRLVPLKIGGDVKTRNTADFSFACTGADPVFTPQDSTP